MLRNILLPLLAALPLAASAANLSDQLTQKAVLNQNVVRQIAAAAEAEARRNNWNVSIAIVDEAGRLMHFVRMDDTPNSSVEVAQGKARHAVNYRRDTKFHQEILEKGNAVVLGLPDITPIEGGLRLLAAGKVIGGIGVSGVQASQDAQIARAGAALLGD
ncbi:GlcG/HbpS family heme-binding protein [Massilia endophytica]|uniref:GlcG/HbpS family heme-binding protein n=1 Tax=Massilia endophytica TaxID=2899220 RepID=UPI001E37B9B0|nr:heme-binding protein [Massilia endophytica]UGQ47138.1 heme-binding protein [Massilia endophytica]